MIAIRRRMIDAGKKTGVTPKMLNRSIKEWLKTSKRGCPWLAYTGCVTLGLCKAMFPRLKKMQWQNCYTCPCNEYSVEYVTKRAKEALR